MSWDCLTRSSEVADGRWWRESKRYRQLALVVTRSFFRFLIIALLVSLSRIANYLNVGSIYLLVSTQGLMSVAKLDMEADRKRQCRPPSTPEALIIDVDDEPEPSPAQSRAPTLFGPSLYGSCAELLPICLDTKRYVVHSLAWKYLPVSDKPCEALARSCLKAGSATWRQLRKLCNLIEVANGMRWPQPSTPLGFGAPRTFQSGAWSRGPLIGLTSTAKSLPFTTALLANIVKGVDLNFKFSAVTFALNVLSRPHKDLQNDPCHDNLLLPCSDWEDGQLWLQDDAGEVALTADGPNGRLHSLIAPFRFNPRVMHATMPWRGDRLVLIGYHSQHTCRLSDADRELLFTLGFNPE